MFVSCATVRINMALCLYEKWVLFYSSVNKWSYVYQMKMIIIFFSVLWRRIWHVCTTANKNNNELKNYVFFFLNIWKINILSSSTPTLVCIIIMKENLIPIYPLMVQFQNYNYRKYVFNLCYSIFIFFFQKIYKAYARHNQIENSVVFIH